MRNTWHANCLNRVLKGCSLFPRLLMPSGRKTVVWEQDYKKEDEEIFGTMMEQIQDNSCNRMRVLYTSLVIHQPQKNSKNDLGEGQKCRGGAHTYTTQSTCTTCLDVLKGLFTHLHSILCFLFVCVSCCTASYF